MEQKERDARLGELVTELDRIRNGVEVLGFLMPVSQKRKMKKYMKDLQAEIDRLWPTDQSPISDDELMNDLAGFAPKD
jgi:hypothetical protein